MCKGVEWVAYVCAFPRVVNGQSVRNRRATARVEGAMADRKHANDCVGYGINSSWVRAGIGRASHRRELGGVDRARGRQQQAVDDEDGRRPWRAPGG